MKLRYAAVALVLLVAVAAVVLLREPGDLEGEIEARMRTVLEQTDPGQHNHAGHQAQAAAGADPAVVCGVHVYGYEPAGTTELAEVRTVYGFHLCGVAEPNRPWDVAVKLAGPVILDMAADPPGIQVVEATEDVRYIDRLQQMFPPKYAEVAQKEALSDAEMTDLRRRYDQAAGLLS